MNKNGFKINRSHLFKNTDRQRRRDLFKNKPAQLCTKEECIYDYNFNKSLNKFFIYIFFTKICLNTQVKMHKVYICMSVCTFLLLCHNPIFLNQHLWCCLRFFFSLQHPVVCSCVGGFVSVVSMFVFPFFVYVCMRVCLWATFLYVLFCLKISA